MAESAVGPQADAPPPQVLARRPLARDFVAIPRLVSRRPDPRPVSQRLTFLSACRLPLASRRFAFRRFASRPPAFPPLASRPSPASQSPVFRLADGYASAVAQSSIDPSSTAPILFDPPRAGWSWTWMSRGSSPAPALPLLGGRFLMGPHPADCPRTGSSQAGSVRTRWVSRQTGFAPWPVAHRAVAAAAAGLVPPSLAARIAQPTAKPPPAASVVSPKSSPRCARATFFRHKQSRTCRRLATGLSSRSRCNTAPIVSARPPNRVRKLCQTIAYTKSPHIIGASGPHRARNNGAQGGLLRKY